MIGPTVRASGLSPGTRLGGRARGCAVLRLRWRSWERWARSSCIHDRFVTASEFSCPVGGYTPPTDRRHRGVTPSVIGERPPRRCRVAGRDTRPAVRYVGGNRPRSAGWLPVRDARKTDASSETRAEQQPSLDSSGATNDRETSRGSRQCAPYVAAPCGDRSTTLPPWPGLGPRHRRECPVRGSAAKGAVTAAPGDRHRASRIGCRGLCTALRSQLPELERRRTAEQCARP